MTISQEGLNDFAQRERERERERERGERERGCEVHMQRWVPTCYIIKKLMIIDLGFK